MNDGSMRALALVVIIAVLVAASTVQAVQITFQVRMSYQVELGNFDPATEFVDLAGNRTEFQFAKARPDIALPAGTFEIKTPDGCEVIEDLPPGSR